MSQITKTNYFKLINGYRLAYNEYGDIKGKPAFYFHGSPGSRLDAMLFHEKAKEYGIHLIAVDRPGIGKSDWQKWQLLDWPNFICELADHLFLKKFGIIGWSGGGPSALACAYSIPDKLTCVMSLAGFPPIDWDGALNYLTKEDRFCAVVAQKRPYFMRFLFLTLTMMAKYAPKSLIKKSRKKVCASDKKVLDDPCMSEILAKSWNESVSQGGKGQAYDATIDYQDWGFRLEDIVMPVHIWQGTADILINVALNDHTANVIQNSIYHKFPDEGHFFVISHMDEIMKTVNHQTV
jgi:pimeloyl-ACP methyl ester carboxylesterase